MQSLTGTMWRLVEARAYDDAGRELPLPLGPEPMGFVMFEAERLMVAASDGRASLPPDEPRRVFAAYCGSYRFDGVELVTRVDGASSPELTMDQVRRIRFESPTRMIIIPVSRVLGHSSGLELVWERVG